MIEDAALKKALDIVSAEFAGRIHTVSFGEFKRRVECVARSLRPRPLRLVVDNTRETIKT